MPGRKKLAVSKLFKDVTTSDTKVPRVAYSVSFVKSSVVKNGSRMKTHVKKCISCPKLQRWSPRGRP